MTAIVLFFALDRRDVSDRGEEPTGAMIRRIVGDDAFDLDLPAREGDERVDFTSVEYGRDDPE